MVVEVCGNCKYCKSKEVLEDFNLYFCVRFPPQDDSFVTLDLGDWCGEWKPKE